MEGCEKMKILVVEDDMVLAEETFLQGSLQTLGNRRKKSYNRGRLAWKAVKK